MYKLLLTFRYLRRKLIPVFALGAVTLCTAMVIIVISVMGGFLDLVRNAGHTVMGDVSLYAGLGGFPQYDQIMAEINKLPEAKASTPIIIAYGLLKIGDRIKEVQVYGIDGAGYDAVTSYRKTLYWTPKRFETRDEYGELIYDSVKQLYKDRDPVGAAIAMKPAWEPVADRPAMVTGIEVSPYNIRMHDGSYRFSPAIVGAQLTLTVLPVTEKGGVIEPAVDQFVVINEFNSGVYDVDSHRVFVPFDAAQRMMVMDAADRVDPEHPTKIIGKIPARCTEIHVKAADGVSANQLCIAVQAAYKKFSETHKESLPWMMMSISTWEQRQAAFLSAVENEKGLMTVLFGIISIVAVVMIGVIFYMIVLEKTRDIGILRAIGASRSGVASIFLSFGLAIGTIGAAMGAGIAYLIVTYINEIHAWLGATFGIVIWDRSVYFFDRIPSHINPREAIVIVLVAIVSSVIGAALPAIKAARVDPVESLRYE
ncbi:MAG: FtsX-like permease family protein [Planctomycetes bacterium]|nr:FtsX-like permease family protein [Planctomycetota bacterium]